MKSKIFRLFVSGLLVLSIAVAYGVNFSDTAEAGHKGKAGKVKEKGGPKAALFCDVGLFIFWLFAFCKVEPAELRRSRLAISSFLPIDVDDLLRIPQPAASSHRLEGVRVGAFREERPEPPD